jgi:hypothetical protein
MVQPFGKRPYGEKGCESAFSIELSRRQRPLAYGPTSAHGVIEMISSAVIIYAIVGV